MMREIEFRGKRTYDGEWVYGYYSKHRNFKNEVYTAIEMFDENTGETYCDGINAVIPDTLGQYTGLKDKNGTKIFEVDIIKARHNADVYIVKFEECRFKIEDCWGNMIKMTQEAINHFECEVIGNIYDNPELIKGDEN